MLRESTRKGLEGCGERERMYALDPYTTLTPRPTQLGNWHSEYAQVYMHRHASQRGSAGFVFPLSDAPSHGLLAGDVSRDLPSNL